MQEQEQPQWTVLPNQPGLNSRLTSFSSRQTVTSSCSFYRDGVDFWTSALEQHKDISELVFCT